MSQSSTLTRCPHCDTRFRVTEEQLGIARGKVRCGNCMEVFNALEHSEAAAPSAPAPSAPRGEAKPREEAPAPAPSKFQQEEEFIFEDDPEEDAAEGNYAGTKTAFDEDELSDSFLQFDEKGGYGDDEEDAGDDIDESWAEAILDENESLSSRPRPASRQPEPEPEPEPEPAPRPQRQPRPEPEPEPAPEEPLDDPFSQRTTFEAPEPEPEEPDNIEFTPDDFVADRPEQPTAREPRAPEPEEPLAATRRMGASLPYDDLRSEPIAIGRGQRSWLRKTLWTLVIVGLVGVLISQVAYFQLDRLSSIPELRPYYEQGCDLIGCDLPPLVAIDRIQSQKLVVRTDPKKRDTLIVDAVLINQAGFEQPFPNIGLTFSNLNGDVVAQSLFEPDEYLSGEAQAMGMMPSQTPVRISITIRDPGRDAVNYNLTFIAPGK